MSDVLDTIKEGLISEPSILKKNKKNEILNNQSSVNTFDKDKRKEKIKEMEEISEKFEVSDSSSCSCSSKEKPTYSYTWQELEQKKLELAYLQKVMLNLKLLNHQQKKSGAKLLKLSLNAKFELSLPELKLNFEMLKKIKYEVSLNYFLPFGYIYS